MIFFWYFGVLSVLPDPKKSIALPFGGFLNNRGFCPAQADLGRGRVADWRRTAGRHCVHILVLANGRSDRQMATGQQFPVFWTSLALIIGFPLLAFILTGFPLEIEFPKASTFNLSGGFQIKPEFLSLYLALSIYTASFIAEIVRAGIHGRVQGADRGGAGAGLPRRRDCCVWWSFRRRCAPSSRR